MDATLKQATLVAEAVVDELTVRSALAQMELHGMSEAGVKKLFAPAVAREAILRRWENERAAAKAQQEAGTYYYCKETGYPYIRHPKAGRHFKVFQEAIAACRELQAAGEAAGERWHVVRIRPGLWAGQLPQDTHYNL